MKSGIKTLFESFFEESIASSTAVLSILESIQTIAVESKKLAEALIQMNERIDNHEKIIVELCALLVEQSEKKKNYQPSSIKLPKTNKDSKPN